MMNKDFTIKGSARDMLGTGASRLVRKQGRIPCVIYGGLKTNLYVSVVEKEITKLYNSGKLFNTKIELQINEDTKTLPVIVQDISLHLITDMITHMDLLLLSEDFHNIKVPIKFAGTESSPGLKRGGFLNKVMRSVLVRCPINNIPESVTCDVSSLAAGNKVSVQSIEIPADCTLVSATNSIVASIIGKS
jgi:large subunit ribosomal protein L25